MKNSITTRSKKQSPWWLKAIVVATLGILSFGIKKLIGRYHYHESTQPISVHDYVDSGTLSNEQNNKGVFINSGSGQQNNNTNSGEQIIINK